MQWQGAKSKRNTLNLSTFNFSENICLEMRQCPLGVRMIDEETGYWTDCWMDDPLHQGICSKWLNPDGGGGGGI